MKPELRNALDTIGAMLETDIGADLWSVLTALRGPDNDDMVLKERTTAPIRTLAFPNLAPSHSYGRNVGYGSGPAGTSVAMVVKGGDATVRLTAAEDSERLTAAGDSADHFINHVEAAAKALGGIVGREV